MVHKQKKTKKNKMKRWISIVPNKQNLIIQKWKEIFLNWDERHADWGEGTSRFICMQSEGWLDIDTASDNQRVD